MPHQRQTNQPQTTRQADTSVLSPFGRLAEQRWFHWTSLAMLIVVSAADIGLR